MKPLPVRHMRRTLLWSALLLVMQPACQTQRQKTPQDPATHPIPKKLGTFPVSSKPDDASRANMGSQEVQFVQQAEKMIEASQEYVQNTTDPTGDLAGAAGEIAQKDPETLGLSLATPDMEEALAGAEGLSEESSMLIPDSAVPAEWTGEHKAEGDHKKIKKEMILGGALIVGGLATVVGGCLVERNRSVVSGDIPSKVSKATLRLGVASGLAGAGLVLWSATPRKDKGSALAAGTQDPARETYLSDLNAVAAEVTRLYAARGGENGLQLARCVGGVRKQAEIVKAQKLMSLEKEIGLKQQEKQKMALKIEQLQRELRETERSETVRAQITSELRTLREQMTSLQDERWKLKEQDTFIWAPEKPSS